jgi:hypothetical protein
VRSWPGSPTGAASLATATVLGIVLGLAGCSGGDGDDEEEPGAQRSHGGTTAEPGIESRVEVGEVVGKLPKGPAREVAADVADVVDGWLDAAYVAGDYPRRDFGDAFRGFTEGAAKLARRQSDLMSNDGVGEKVDDVTATRRVIRVDVLAPKGKAAAATAHVNLVMKLTGDVDRTDQIRGRVVLTRSKNGWRVFGFDIERGRVKG